MPLMKKYVLELVKIRRKLRRLQELEQKALKKITRGSDKYVGFKKTYEYKSSKVNLKIKKAEPRVIEAKRICKVLGRRINSKQLQDDFCSIVTVSYKKVKRKYGKAFADRMAYKKGCIHIVVTEVIKNGK